MTDEALVTFFVHWHIRREMIRTSVARSAPTKGKNHSLLMSVYLLIIYFKTLLKVGWWVRSVEGSGMKAYVGWSYRSTHS